MLRYEKDQLIEYEEEAPIQGKSIQNERDAKAVIQQYLDGNGLAKAGPV